MNSRRIPCPDVSGFQGIFNSEHLAKATHAGYLQAAC